MRVGGISNKILQDISKVDPNQLSRMQTDVKNEQKESQKASVSAKKLGSLMGEMEGITSGIASTMGELLKAAMAKPKGGGDEGKDKKASKGGKSPFGDIPKVMEAMKQQQIKMLEAKIAEAEKELAQLKKYLASAKSSKPGGWFK